MNFELAKYMLSLLMGSLVTLFLTSCGTETPTDRDTVTSEESSIEDELIAAFLADMKQGKDGQTKDSQQRDGQTKDGQAKDGQTPGDKTGAGQPSETSDAGISKATKMKIATCAGVGAEAEALMSAVEQAKASGMTADEASSSITPMLDDLKAALQLVSTNDPEKLAACKEKALAASDDGQTPPTGDQAGQQNPQQGDRAGQQKSEKGDCIGEKGDRAGQQKPQQGDKAAGQQMPQQGDKAAGQQKPQQGDRASMSGSY